MVIYGAGGQVDNINLDKKLQKNMSFEIVGTPEQVDGYLSKFNPDCLVKVKLVRNHVMHPFRFAPFSKLLPEYFKLVADPDTKFSDFMTIVAGCTSFEMKFEFGKIDYNKLFRDNLIWFYNSENHQVSIDFLQRYIKESFENKDEVKCTLFPQAGVVFRVFPKDGYEISDEDLDKLEARLVKECLLVDEA